MTFPSRWIIRRIAKQYDVRTRNPALRRISGVNGSAGRLVRERLINGIGREAIEGDEHNDTGLDSLHGNIVKRHLFSATNAESRVIERGAHYRP
jgi:hypothetical protein